jgi:glutathionylspermidine synthase
MTGSGINLQVQDDFGTRYEMGENDKNRILSEFGQLFHKCAEMMVWFDNGQVEAKDKLEYWGNFFNIFESLHELIVLMLKAGITETQIMEQLNIPF